MHCKKDNPVELFFFLNHNSFLLTFFQCTFCEIFVHIWNKHKILVFLYTHTPVIGYTDFLSWQCLRYFRLGKAFKTILEKVFFFILSNFFLSFGFCGQKFEKLAHLRV
jgi:hypothetical protein